MNQARNEAWSVGRTGVDLEREDYRHFKDSYIAKEESRQGVAKDILECAINAMTQSLSDVWAEMEKISDLLGGCMSAERKQTTFLAFLLVICLAGDWVFVRWCLDPFGLGYWETCLVTSGIIIIFMKGFDGFLSAFKIRWKRWSNTLIFILSSIGITLVFVQIVLSSDIRGSLFQLSTVLGDASMEEIVKSSKAFYEGTSSRFSLLMMVLTSSVTVIGGLTYHQTREKVFLLRRFRSLQKQEYRLLMSIQGKKQEIARLGSAVPEITFAIDSGYFTEVARQNRRKAGFLYQLAQSILKSPLLKVGVLAFIVFLSVMVLVRVGRCQTITVLDLSASVDVRGYADQKSEFQRNVRGIDDLLQMVPPGERVVVIGITERSYSNPYILLDGKVTANKGAFGEKAARDKLALINQWRKLDLRPVAKSTDIFGAVHLAANLFSGSSSKRKNLVFFSDMRHYSDGINFESVAVIDSEKTLAVVKNKGFVPSLGGASVWCLGVDTAGKTPVYWESLKHFWTRYFELAKASRLCAFSMERKLEGF